jgi:O-antigen ligase
MLLRVNKNIETQIYSWLLIALVYSMLFISYITSILSLLLFISWLLFSKKSFVLSSLKTRLMILFATLYLIYIAGLFYSSDILSSVSTVEAKSAILFFPLVFGTTTILNRSLVEKITTHFLIATTIAAVVTIIYGVFNYMQTGETELLTGKNILFFPGFRPFLMGLFCITAIIIAFEKINTGTKTKNLLYAGIMLLSATILLLNIRMMLAAWIVIIIYYLLTSVKSRKQKIILAAITLFAIVISIVTIPPIKDQWKEFFDSRSQIVLDQDSSLGKSWGGKALRIAIWKSSADILKGHWLTGVGTGDVQDSLQQAYENRKFYFASRYNHYNAHNQYIQITLATGVAGLLILISCILYPLWKYHKRFSSEIYVVFILLFSFICFTESLLEANKGVVWYSFFNSIFAFGYLKPDLNE